MLLFDQISSWILVFLCYWITHQTAAYGKKKKDAALILMRVGVALLGLSVAVVSIFQFFDIVFIAGGVWKMCVNLVFIGVIIFHKSRFNQL